MNISINSDLSIESDHEITKTEQQYIDLLQFILKDLLFNEFTLITDDLALETTRPTTRPILALTVKKDTQTYKLCSIWGLMLHKKINSLLQSSRPWSSKISKAIWRGSTTGQDSIVSDRSLRKYTRFQLVSIAQKRQDLIDAGFTSVVQYALKNKQKFDLKMSPSMTQEEQSMYKYIVIADGNSGTYSFYWVLASGSVPLKQDSDYIQYFEEKEFGLSEYIHYVPIKKDFSDLFEKIMWLQLNDDKAYEISRNAMKFAQEHFTYNSLKDQLINLVK